MNPLPHGHEEEGSGGGNSIATASINFENYLKARKLHLLVSIFYNGKCFAGFFKLIDECELDLAEFVVNLSETFMANPTMQGLLKNFMAETQLELFESEAAILEYFKKKENFEN